MNQSELPLDEATLASAEPGPRWTVRVFLVVLVLACLLPGIIGAAVFFTYEYRQGLSQLDTSTIQTARALVQAVDNQILRAQSLVQGLATDSTLVRGDLAEFHARARRALEQSNLGTNIVLSDRTGQQLINTSKEFGDPLPRVPTAMTSVSRVFETGAPVVSDLFGGPVLGRPLMAVSVPVLIDGKVAYALSATLLPERFHDILRSQGLPPGWVVTICDSASTIVARSRDMDEWLGRKPAAAYLREVADSNEGVFDFTMGDGVPVRSHYTKSSVTGWWAVVNIPSQALQGHLFDRLFSMAVVAVGLFALAVALAWFVGGRISRSVRSLVSPAMDLGAGRAVLLPSVQIKEAADVSRAMAEAARLLRERTRALEERESHLRQIRDWVPGMVWTTDAKGAVDFVSPQWLEYTGAASETQLGPGWIDVIHPEDRSRTAEAWQAAAGERTTYDIEYRLRRYDGVYRWFKARAVPMRDGSGRIERWFGMSIDIHQLKDAQEALRASQERLQMALDVASLGVWDWDLDSDTVDWDERSEEIFGLPAHDPIPFGRYLSLVHPEDRQKILDADRAALEQHAQANVEYRVVWPNGEVRWVLARARAVYDAEDRPKGMAGTVNDITESKRAKEERNRLTEHLQMALEAARMVVWEFNPGTGEVSLSENAEAVLALPGGKRHQHCDDGYALIHPDDVERHRALVTHAIETGGSFASDYRVAGGEQVIWLEERGRAVLDETGKTVRLVGVSHNITERKLAEQRVQYLAHHDLLTGLPNRTLTQVRLEDMVARAERHHYRAAVLYIDLDNFKPVNDSFGHQVGDELLHNAGQRLAACVRRTDTVGRMGGDEFVVLLDELRDADEAALIAGNIIEKIAQPFHLAGQPLYVSASIGIACYPNDGKMPETLLRHADAAMYRAKEEGKNLYRFFSSAMNRGAHEKLLLIASLRQAIEQDELLLCYQPRVCAQTLDILGVEALVRWRSPVHGLVQPARFIGFAEENGLIEPIGEWVLRKACEEMKRWESEGRAPLFVSVNLSARQFRQPRLAERIESILQETGLEPGQLELEITESVVMINPEKAEQVLKRLAGLGVRLSLDDFGTGHSSLAYLQRFPVHHLKLDQSFVRELPENKDSAAIVKAVVAMAKSLELGVTAEGVETEPQREFLVAAECNALQGYLFSEPLTAEGLELFRDRRQSP